MAKDNKKTYWPVMILGFLMVGFTLSYWTVKSASSLPVQEVNNYMLKYQQADININEILEKKAFFDKNYIIEIIDAHIVVQELENAKRAKEEKVVLLASGLNTFSYYIRKRDGTPVIDANVTFLLTRPHTIKEDMLIANVNVVDKKYLIEDINITKAGRYTLQFKAKIGDAIGYSELPAYLKP